MPTYTSTEPNGDVLLAQAMPEAEYMYGCTPTAAAMILGYYDLYGYRGADLSNMIEGDVDLKSRGTDEDGNAYDMDSFDTALGRATATESFVSRFHSRGSKETTPSQELKYAFKSDNKTFNMDCWDCIADYLGTGQYWRGNDNLSTTITYGTLEDILDDDRTIEITAGSTKRTVRYVETTMLYGLDLYVQSRGYAMDYEITGSYVVDVAGGSFTFADYMREIDGGRPVMISVSGHSMVGYGYNADTQEIIFDDCYVSGRRMKWNGTYRFDKVDRKLQGITVIGINVNGSVDPAIETAPGGTWEKIVLTSAPDAQENMSYCFAGTAILLNCTVSNRGTKDTGEFRASIRVDGELVRTETPDSIPGGAQCNMQNIPLGELTVGLHNVRVILDEDNELQELSASNNTAETAILVLKTGTSVVDSFRTVDSGETVADVYVPGGANLTLTDGKASGVVLRGTVTASTAENITWTPAQFIVSQGGYASGTDVYDYGSFHISGGGTAEDTRVFSKGSAFVQDGGTLRDAIVSSGGRLVVSSGGRLTGLIRLEEGASARFSGGTLDFDLSTLTPGAAARVNDLSGFAGSPVYTLTVSGTQEHGTYRLADGVASFRKTITVRDTGGSSLGTLSVGQTTEINGSDYKLVLDGGSLSLTVSDHIPVDSVVPEVSDVRADITEPTWQDVVVKADFSDDRALESRLYRIGRTGAWTEYTDDGVTVSENTAVFFKAVDTSGNESEIAEYDVTNILSSGCVLFGGQVMTILPGRTYTDTVLSGGSMHVSGGGTADGVTVDDGGTVTVEADGRVTGRMCFAPGADVFFDTGAVLMFDISALAPGTDAQANGISFIQGTPLYTLAVSGSQKKGLYLLADGTGEFRAAVSVRDASGSLLGVLEPGQTANIGGSGYSLNRSDNMLTLTIGAAGVANGADCGWNNWLYNKKTKAVNLKVRDSDPVVLNPGTTAILPDTENTVLGDDRHNFVGFCDAADFMKINLDCAMKLSFAVNASGAAKFVIYRLVEGTDRKGNPTYKLTSVQTTTLTKKKQFTATTKSLLLEKGDYYIAMQASGTKKDSSAYYNVSLNTDEGKTVFFSDGDDGSNNWLYDKKKSNAPNPLVRNADGIALSAPGSSILIDADAPTGEDAEGWNNFVGFGDAADYAKLDLSGPAKVSFTVNATGAAKFVIYRLVEGTDRKGNPTCKLKAVLTRTLKKNKEGIYTATTKTVSLPVVENGEYFISVQSTTAKKGKCAYYNVTLDTFEPADLAMLLPQSDGLDELEPGMAGCSGTDGGMQDGLNFTTQAAEPAVPVSIPDPATEKMFGGSGTGLLASL